MTDDKALARIETPEFFTHVNLASGYNLFKHFMASFPAVMDLLASIDNPTVASKVFARAKELLCVPCRGEYAHSWDSAIAAYCWVLTASRSDYAQRLASDILTMPGFWWAKKIAKEVKDEKASQHASSDSIGWNRIYTGGHDLGGSQQSPGMRVVLVGGQANSDREESGSIQKWQAPRRAKVG